MHAAARQFVEWAVVSIPKRRSVIEIGSRQVNGTVRDLFEGPTFARLPEPPFYVGIDLIPGPLVDVLADARTWRPLYLVDTVVCTSVLEHTAHGEELVKAASEMLKKDGVLILTTVGEPCEPHSAFDGGPLPKGEYYRNIGPEELQTWVARYFTKHEVQYDPPDIFILAVK